MTCAIASGTSLHAATDPAEVAIHQTVAAFVDAFHRGDSRALAAVWTPVGDYIDETGHLPT